MTCNIDDEVYFHHKGVPKVGKVLCAGKHGCTVKGEDGVDHRLKHEHIAGFKTRAPQRYHVEHQGEDGLIVRNQHGHRRLVTIPAEAREQRYELDDGKPPKAKSNGGNPGA